MAGYNFPNKPTIKQLEWAKAELLAGKVLTSRMLREKQISPRRLLETLRHEPEYKLPIVTSKKAVELSDKIAAQMGEPDFYETDSGYGNGEASSGLVGMKCFFWMRPIEIHRFYEDRKAQIAEYDEVRRLDKLRKDCKKTYRSLISMGLEPYKEVIDGMQLDTPAVTDGTSDLTWKPAPKVKLKKGKAGK